MSRTKKSDLIKSSYRLAALIILVSININILSAQSAGVVIKKGGPIGKGTQIGTTSTTPTQAKVANTNGKKIKSSIDEVQKAMESMEKAMQSIPAEKAKEAANTHKIGESYGGGIVFHVTDNGLHGLIAETQDQSSGCNLEDAQDLSIRNPSNHSKEGQKYIGWYLPDRNELNLLYLQKSVVGGFANNYYWSASPNGWPYVWVQNFANGHRYYPDPRGKSNYVRAIRSF